MTLPIAFLLGLLVVVAHRELGDALPGSATLDGVVGWAIVLFVPSWLAAIARNSTVAALTRSRRPLVPPRALLRLSALSVPACLHLLFAAGSYGDAIDRIAPGSHTARIALTLLPLYLAELPRVTLATMVDGLLARGVALPAPIPLPVSWLPSWSEVRPIWRLRLGWPLLALLPAALLGVSLDVLQLDRAWYAVALVSTAGLSCAAISFLFLVVTVLPLWFRVAFGLRRDLPEPHAEWLRHTATALDFPAERVYVMPTGRRAINAMMVGPLRFGRLLAVTDGLLATLDPRALSGVLAHEVGHARMGHPGLLMLLAIVVPLMLLSPLRLLDGADVDVELQAVVMLVATALVWWIVRTLARRFEYEADVASVRALGAGPCSDALRSVSHGSIAPPRSLLSRLLSLHPEESRRLQLMQRYEGDAEFRSRFDRGTRRVRVGIAALLCLASALGASFWALDWSYENVVVQFYSGDFVGAQRSLGDLGDLEQVPERWRLGMQRITAEVDCALELVPDADGRNWPAIAQRLDPAAWQRGEQALLSAGPTAARPWFALANMASRDPDGLRLAIAAWCEAAADEDVGRMQAIAAVVRDRGVPVHLSAVFASPQ